MPCFQMLPVLGASQSWLQNCVAYTNEVDRMCTRGEHFKDDGKASLLVKQLVGWSVIALHPCHLSTFLVHLQRMLSFCRLPIHSLEMIDNNQSNDSSPGSDCRAFQNYLSAMHLLCIMGWRTAGVRSPEAPSRIRDAAWLLFIALRLPRQGQVPDHDHYIEIFHAPEVTRCCRKPKTRSCCGYIGTQNRASPLDKFVLANHE